MAKDFIVAIELGSSKITGIAGKKNLDGSISILGIVQENSSQYIRRGVIYKFDKTMTALINVKQRLENQLQTKIRQVYVGVGGQSIVSVKNTIVRELPDEPMVTQEMVHELMDTNRNMSYPDKEILDAISLEYKVDAQYQADPVGIQCARLEGNFLNILWRKAFYTNLNRCFEEARIPIADMYLAPLTLAESVVGEADRRAGCLLVDLGAETTTVSVYYKNVLRHLAVLPVGGANITRDIATLQIEEDEAERMKLKYGSAYTDNAEIDNELTYPISDGRSVESRRFIELVEARVLEIVENVWFQVPAGYQDKLLGGIILTGGGANMKNIDKVFRQVTRVEKIRFARSVNQTVDATQPEVNAQDCRLCTALSLLAKGDMNCAGEQIKSGLFEGGEGEGDGSGEEETPAGPRPIPPTGKGVVLTEAEKKRLEEEEKRRKEEEEAAAAAAAAEAAAAAKEKKRQNSPFNRLVRGIKKFVNTAISEED